MHFRNLSMTILAAAVELAAAGQPSEVAIPAQLTLQQAIQLMGQHNSGLRAEQLNVDQERADLLSASKRPNPVLAFSSEGLSPHSDSFDGQELSITLRMPFETAGKRGKRTRVEESEVEIADLAYQDFQRRSIFALKQAYFRLMAAREDLKLAREILEHFENVVRIDRVRFQRGEISGGELRRAEAEQYRFFEDVVSAEVDLENSQDALLAQIGVASFEKSIEAVDRFDPSFRAPPIEQLNQMAMRSRRDLAAQRKRMDRSTLSLELEKAGQVPDVTPFAGYRRDFGADGVVFGVELPLSVFRRNRSGVARARARIQQEELRLSLLEVAVRQEVQAALNRIDGNRRRVQALQANYLNKARQARDIAESAYRIGGASLIEFLDAERTFRQTARLYNRALFDFQISRAALELAVGEDLP